MKLGLYIHIPFCAKKCKYCDFISFPESHGRINEYFEALKKEILNNKINNKEISTIYIGGGTPSFVHSKYIVEIISLIRNNYVISEDAEITIEINPGTIDKNKLLDYKKMGVNRISIGLQSACDRLLELIGRIHKYEDFLKTYNLVKEVGFNNINVDLMLALPTQTIDDLTDTLNKIIDLEPNHISLYSLILEENTELEYMINNKKLELINEIEERRMYHLSKKILEKNGYIHYEISNFAQKGFESKHNMDCWNQEEYIGMGLSAHSYFNNKRFSNTIYLDKYIENIKNGNFEKNIEIHEVQEKEDKMKEYMMLGFRKLKGISITEFEKKFRINPLFYFRFELEKLTDQGLIEVDLDNIKLTKSGLDLANIVFEEFV